MQERRALVLVAGLVCCAVSAIAGPGQGSTTDLDAYISAYVRALDFHGTVLVARGGTIIHHRPYGVAVREWGTPHTLLSRFPIASISKPMTALVVVRLVEAGRMGLDTSLSTYLPDLPRDKGDRITIRQLLTHTAGIGHWGDAPEFEAWKERIPQTREQLIRRYGELPLVAEPGVRYAYSSFGYNLLAFACENAAGKPFSELLDTYVFRPAGMTRASALPGLEILEGVAPGYEDRHVDGYQKATPLHPSHVVGAGGVVATVEDLFRFARYVFSSPGVSRELRRQLIGRHVATGKETWYGYGWNVAISTLTSSEAYSHGGVQNGAKGELCVYPDLDVIVAILSNVRPQRRGDDRHPSIAGLRNGVVRVLLGQTPDVPGHSLSDDLAAWIRTDGVDAALSRYRTARRSPPPGAYASELETNMLGYRYYSEKHDFGTALAILRQNLADYPESYNVYDSLGWLHDQAGDTDKADSWYLEGLRVFERFPEKNARWARDAEAAKKRLNGRTGSRQQSCSAPRPCWINGT